MNDTQDQTSAQLQSGSDKAQAALAAADDQAMPAATSSNVSTDDEVAASDQIAETITSLQNLIERHADELDEVKSQIKEHRQSLRNVFENDPQLAEAQEQAQQVTAQVKDRKSKLMSDPTVTTLKVKIGELNEQKKEIEETLSNHLVNFFGLTNSTSFDTSDGDQREFTIRAAVKGGGRK